MSATALARLEQIVNAAGVCEQIEARLPIGVRPRQLSVRTLLIGMLLVAVEGRPAHLRRVHRALAALPEDDQRRLGVLAHWNTGPHQLSYRQLEYTFTLLVASARQRRARRHPLSAALRRARPAPGSQRPTCGGPPSSSFAVDWTDLETWARPPRKDGQGRCADPEAAWGHRTSNHPAQTESSSATTCKPLTTVADEHGPEVPELVRRIHLASCQHDPPAQIIPIIARMHQAAIPIGDLLADSGYSYRQPETFALPPAHSASNSWSICTPTTAAPKAPTTARSPQRPALLPRHPHTLLALGPLPPAATSEQTLHHDQQSAELARYKLAPITAPDTDGYRRAGCPAAHNKIRCPLQPDSLACPTPGPPSTSRPSTRPSAAPRKRSPSPQP